MMFTISSLFSHPDRLTFRVFVATLLALIPLAASAQPAVVATAEGQLGATPAFGDKLQGPAVEGLPPGTGPISLQEVLAARLVDPLLIGASQVQQFSEDRIHTLGTSSPLGTFPIETSSVFGLSPRSAFNAEAGNLGGLAAFSFTTDGDMPSTQDVVVTVFNADGSTQSSLTLSNLETFPDPVINDTGVAVDDQGRVTVVYTELNLGQARVRAQRFDGVTGSLIGGAVDVTTNRGDPDVALLDPAGNRLIVATSNNVDIRGNILDFSGPTTVVLPEFPISTTPGILNILPDVAADPATGNFTVVWENATGNVGDPVNIRGRRFDADGNPVGGDFQVNTNSANAQGQPAMAYGSDGNSAVVWAGDSIPLGTELEVFGQMYDAMGNPIGGEIRVNSDVTDVQDRPAVRFLPERDAQGRPQVVVAWRDVEQADGSGPRGTGTSYKCFSIDGLGPPPPQEIFADGFESGDTTSWSDTQP